MFIYSSSWFTLNFTVERSRLPPFHATKVRSPHPIETVDFLTETRRAILLLHPRGVFSKPATFLAIFMHQFTSQQPRDDLWSHHVRSHTGKNFTFLFIILVLE